MATITAQVLRQQDGNIVVLWETLTATNNVGSDVHFPDHKLESIQAIGTFGGTVTVAGSNAVAAGGTFTTMEDVASVAVSTTAAAFFALGADARWVHPTAGAGVSDVDVYALFVPRRGR